MDEWFASSQCASVPSHIKCVQGQGCCFHLTSLTTNVPMLPATYNAVPRSPSLYRWDIKPVPSLSSVLSSRSYLTPVSLQSRSLYSVCGPLPPSPCHLSHQKRSHTMWFSYYTVISWGVLPKLPPSSPPPPWKYCPPHLAHHLHLACDETWRDLERAPRACSPLSIMSSNVSGTLFCEAFQACIMTRNPIGGFSAPLARHYITRAAKNMAALSRHIQY